MKTTWADIVNRVLRSVGCWVVAALMVWRGWTCADAQGTESILCCFSGFTLMVTGIAIGVGAEKEPEWESA